MPKLRFPEFRGTDGWNERPLGEFLSESRLPGSKGNVAKKITVKLWGNGVFEKNDAIQGSINTQYFRRKAGQFIYSKLDFLNQAFGIIPPSLDNFESTVDLPCFDFADGLNSVFLLEYVKRRDFYERLGETADGSRKARRIHAETFLSFPIALPSPAEQQKIAECLSSVDELIAAQARKLDALKTHKKGLMQELFPREGETQPCLRFPEFQNAGEWNAFSLHELCSVITKGSTPTSYGYEYVDSGIRFIKIESLFDGLINSSKTMFITPECDLTFARSKLKEHDILFSIAGGLGFVAIVRRDDLPANINQALAIVRLNSGLSHEFIMRYLGSSLIQGEIHRIKAGAAQPNISLSQLGGFQVLLPSLLEQQRIADCLSCLDELIAAQTQKLAALKTHKQGLMQQLFPYPEEVEA